MILTALLAASSTTQPQAVPAACPDGSNITISYRNLPGVESEHPVSSCGDNYNTQDGQHTKEHLCVPSTKSTPCCYGTSSPRKSAGNKIVNTIFCVSQPTVAWLNETYYNQSNGEKIFLCDHLVRTSTIAESPAASAEVVSVNCTSVLQDSSDTPQGLSPGAVAGIVVGAVLGPFLLGGIYSYFS